MENIIVFIAVLLIPCITFSIVNFTYSKYKEKDNKKKLSGFEVARKILDDNELKDIYIVEIKSNLNDHYDYKQKVIRLSTDVFHGESLTALAVAAKIASYAVLDKKNYQFMKIKFTLIPVFNLCVYFSYILFIVALCMQDYSMVMYSTALIVIVLIFHIITLPVEFETKKISLKSLKDTGVILDDEENSVISVLNVSSFIFIMNIITCISYMISEIKYNLQRKG